MTLSPEQLELRRAGITATDVSAIVGVNPWKTPLAVFLEKTGQAAPFDGNARTEWGHALEPLVRADYERRHDVRVEVRGTLSHPKFAWMKATPDGIVFQNGAREADRGLEIKVHGASALMFGGIRYGTPGTDEVPLFELCQCSWGIHVTGFHRWDLVMFDGAPNEYVIDRDDELIAMLVDRSRRFLIDHVAKGIPPEPDGSKDWDNYLRRHKSSEDLISIDDNDAMVVDIEELKRCREAAAEADRALEVCEQRIKRFIGERGGIVWTGKGGKPQRITWRHNKPSSYTDWIGVMADMRQAAALVASGYTKHVEALLTHLHKTVGGGYLYDAQGNPYSGIEIFKAITALRETLTDIARAATTKDRTKQKPGARPFNVPRHWKAPKGKEQRDE